MRTMQPGIALNEDNSHFFYTRAGMDITDELIDGWVDQYAGTQVRELIISPNSMRTSYGSNVWTPIWHGYDPDGPDDQPLFASLPAESRANARKWVHTAWVIEHAGIDIYERWIRRCRKKGLSPWLSMRMNDLHGVDDENCFMHSEFWRQHPEYRRVAYKTTDWRDRAFDYGHAEVRDYHMLLIDELLKRYDPDGLELDWMRFGFHFKPGYEEAGAEILTGFMRTVRSKIRDAEQTRGHGILLSARVPALPVSALNLGMDAVTWAREELVDWLVPTPFWASVDTAIPVNLWTRMISGTGVRLAPGLEVIIRSHPGMEVMLNSLETIRGTAAGYIQQGVDRIYLFNHMDSQTTIGDSSGYPALIREAGDLEAMSGKPRRHVVTYPDTWAPGEAKAAALPVTPAPGEWCAFRLLSGPEPASSQSAYVVLYTQGNPKEDAFLVYVNGVRCTPADAAAREPHPELPHVSQRIPSGALHGGQTVIEVCSDVQIEIDWVELFIE